jgi:hypothetical protein
VKFLPEKFGGVDFCVTFAVQKSTKQINKRQKTMKTIKQFKVTTTFGTAYLVMARSQKEAKEIVMSQYLKGCDYKKSDLKATSTL